MPSYIEINPAQHNSGEYKIKDAIRDIDPNGTIVMRSGVYFIDHWDDMDTLAADLNWPNGGIATAMRIQKLMTIKPEDGGWAEVAYDRYSQNTPYQRCALTIGGLYTDFPSEGGVVTVGSPYGTLYFSCRHQEARVRAALWSAKRSGKFNLVLHRVNFMTTIGEFFGWEENISGVLASLINGESQIFLRGMDEWRIYNCTVPIWEQWQGIRNYYAPSAILQGTVVDKYGADAPWYPPKDPPEHPLEGMVPRDLNLSDATTGSFIFRYKAGISLYGYAKNVRIYDNTFNATISGRGYGVGAGLHLGDSNSQCYGNRFYNLKFAYLAECCPNETNYVTVTTSGETYSGLVARHGIINSGTGDTVPWTANCVQWCPAMNFDRIRFV